MLFHRRSTSRQLALSLPLVGTLIIALGAPASASASAPSGSYTITRTVGSFVPSGNSVFGFDTPDDAVRTITTPFALRVFGVNYTRITISTNGNIQFSNSGSASFSNDCLPTAQLNKPMLAVYWDDLDYADQSVNEGVFAKVVGTGPNRKFVVAWRGHRFGTTNSVRVEAVFFRGRTNIQLNYLGPNVSDTSATIGIQRGVGVGGTTQWICNGNPASRVLVSGDRLNLKYQP